ncbi:MAG: hypothetical protein AB7R55_10595 [Gemmatimonadales bacterium]
MRLAILVGCVLALTPTFGAMAQDSTPPPKKLKKLNNLIATWEITEVQGHVQDAFALVTLLRPRWLQSRVRGGTAGGNPVWGQGPGVLMDGVPRGGIGELRTIPLGAVKEIRHMSGPDAVNRYGIDFHAGAINVIAR